MATRSFNLCQLLLFLSTLTLSNAWECPQGLIAFGDSQSDTGNVHALFPSGVPGGFHSGFPYGITWPGYDTGRSSDGRMIVDYIAHAFGLGSRAEAYFSVVSNLMRTNFTSNVNFAETGSTAGEAHFHNPFHLMIQLQHFLEFKKRVLSLHHQNRGDGDCGVKLPKPSFFNTSLYFIFIGGNDINFNLKPDLGNKSADEIVQQIIPQAVAAIVKTIQILHHHGARKFLVFGRPPLGCTPIFKVSYKSSNPEDYDSNGCLILYNQLTLVFQNALNTSVQELRTRYKDSSFFFADLYSSFYEIIKNPHRYGFRNTANACCGASGALYNFSPAAKCGSPGATACSRPSEFVSWDGNHFTQHFYETVAGFFLSGKFLSPPVSLLSCEQGDVLSGMSEMSK